jgi:pimeloyl-ACP methyl ester carboxylesterase
MIRKPAFAALAAMLLTGCIRTQNYHPDKSTFYYKFKADDPNYSGKSKDHYFETANAYEAYVEFDARGSLYRDESGIDVQRQAALDLIKRVKQPARKIALYVFIHGWKNNASEDTGNVWGFRRFLSEIAAQHCNEPVVGVYIGWPGASIKGDNFLTFWNREPVADNVGNNADLSNTLELLLQAAKGADYNDGSTAVVIGHSFGGIVLEHAAIQLLEKQLAKSAESPADLFILLNEAGAAAIGRPFLMDLVNKKVTYNDQNKHPHPLLLSMTSTGDVATKFAYPGGEYISFKRPATDQYPVIDKFGQQNTLPYNLLTAANMIALQSHQIVQCTAPAADGLQITLTAKTSYCMNPITDGRLNTTPYWIMQLPQVFVPDHSSVFQIYVLKLVSAVLGVADVTSCGAGKISAEAAHTPTGRPSLKRN